MTKRVKTLDDMDCPVCKGVKSPQAVKCMGCWTAERNEGTQYTKSGKKFDWEKLRIELKDFAKKKGLTFYD